MNEPTVSSTRIAPAKIVFVNKPFILSGYAAFNKSKGEIEKKQEDNQARRAVYYEEWNKIRDKIREELRDEDLMSKWMQENGGENSSDPRDRRMRGYGGRNSYNPRDRRMRE
jgi:hypothetical protein